MGQVHQKRYNLMIVGEEAVNRLDSLPERHKGIYVSEAIVDRVRKEREANYFARNFAPSNEYCDTKEVFDEYLRRIVRDELKKTKDDSAD